MPSSLSHNVDNLSVINRKIEKSENKFIDNLGTMLASLSRSVDKISEINKKISLIKLSEKFHNTYHLCNKDLNKFALLLGKGVYPYGDMDSWKKFKETTLPPKQAFYSNLNKEGVSEEDYVHAQKVWKEFNIKNLGNIMACMFRAILHYLRMCLKILEINS